MPNIDKKIFLIASGDDTRQKEVAYLIEQSVLDATFYFASDGMDALFRMDNVPPHIFVSDIDLPKVNGFDVITKSLRNKKCTKLSSILIGSLPQNEVLIDEVINGQVHFVEDLENPNIFKTALNKALNFISFGDSKGYKIVFLKTGDYLFKQHDKGDSVYLLKAGKLEALVNETKSVGNILAGEFVGEMSHFNHEPRSASVRALSDCELIQIPFGTLDAVLLQKPAWARALIHTLSKRLKNTLST